MCRRWFLLLFCLCIFPSDIFAGNLGPFATGELKHKVSEAIATRLYKLKFVSVKDIQQEIKEAKALGGISVIADKRSNYLWVKSSVDKLNEIGRLISKIDVPARQIQIKASIVSVDEAALNELGIEFHSQSIGITKVDGMNFDMPRVASKTGQFNVAVASLGYNRVLEVQVAALASEGRGEVLASPELVTAENHPAYIASGEQVPFQNKTGLGNTSISFKDAVLSLRVVPHVVGKNKLLLDLEVKQDAVSSLRVNGVPAISTRQIQTQAIVGSGHTLVLGGIYLQSKNNSRSGIPVLSSIPLLGSLFSHRLDNNRRQALLIFVTPKIC